MTTFTKEQADCIARSYSSEIQRLLDIKASKDLTILNLTNQLAAKEKELEELKKTAVVQN